jgi:hypothetical protein
MAVPSLSWSTNWGSDFRFWRQAPQKEPSHWLIRYLDARLTGTPSCSSVQAQLEYGHGLGPRLYNMRHSRFENHLGRARTCFSRQSKLLLLSKVPVGSLITTFYSDCLISYLEYLVYEGKLALCSGGKRVHLTLLTLETGCRSNIMPIIPFPSRD